MPNILQTAINQGLSSALGAGVVEVTYKRGGVTKTINATPGRTSFEQADDDGLIVRTEVRDWLVERNELEVTGFGEPQKGDLIVEAQTNKRLDDVTTYTYEVNPLGGTQHFREMDPGHFAYRIHTKRINTATV